MFKKKEHINEETMIDKIDIFIEKLDDEFERRKNWEYNKEKYLFETLDANGELYKDKTKLLEEKIVLKDTLNIKEKLIEKLENEKTAQSKTIRNLSDEINDLVKYRIENEALKKDKAKLEKELQKLKDDGVVVPKKVRATGPTKATKQLITPKKGKIGGAELKMKED